MKKTNKVLATILILAALLILPACESLSRVGKTIDSSMRGLNREIVVYNSAGKEIFKGEGMVDVESNEYGNKVLFDLDGKRHIFYNCSVSIIEK